MCCSWCCDCDRVHVDDADAPQRPDVDEVHRLVADVVARFDMAHYGVNVTALPGRDLDARMETWRRELVATLVNEIQGELIEPR